MKKQERGLSPLLNSPESASIFVAREHGKAIERHGFVASAMRPMRLYF